MFRGNDRQTVLYVIHKKHWNQTRIAEVLCAAGFAVEFRCHAAGDPLPDELSGYSGVVLGGGMHSVYEAHKWPYLARELKWTRRLVEQDMPFLGICLGSQVLAGAFGGEMAPRADGLSEYGFYPIQPTPAGRPLFDGLSHVYQAHYESCAVLPAEAELLATGEHFRSQAFRIGERALGVQFHPDARLGDISTWCREGAENLKRPGAQSMEKQLELAPRYEAAIQSWTERAVAQLFGTAEGVEPARAASG